MNKLESSPQRIHLINLAMVHTLTGGTVTLLCNFVEITVFMGVFPLIVALYIIYALVSSEIPSGELLLLIN